MHFFVALIFLLIIAGIFAYHQMPPKVWVPVFIITLISYHLTHATHLVLLLLFDLIFIAVATITLIKSLRLQLISHPLFLFIQRNLPAISKTEKEALAAGDVWWEKELFCGKPNWKTLLAMEKPRLSQREQAFLDNQVEALCALLNDWEINHVSHDLPKNAWEYIKKERFLGLVISKEYGGHAFSTLAHSSIITKVASRSLSTAISIMVPNSLGPAELLTHYGTQEQKNYYLPRLARGEEIPCFALTEPLAGSDAANIQNHGVICKGRYNDQEVLGLKLTWDKRYITLAPIATILGLAIKTYDPQHFLSKKENLGITLCLIPTKHPGVEIGKRHFPLGMGFMNGPTSGKDVFIPMEWIIGGEKEIGNGWRMLMECLSIGRAISLPSVSTATAHLCFRTTGAYALARKQFNVPIGTFEGIKLKLAEIAAYSYQLEATRIMTASAVDQNIKPTVASAITKYHLTELSREILNNAMDIHGGRSIQLGPRNYLGHGYQAIPIAITVEGANILTRNLIIFGQGAFRCHPYLREEMEITSGELTPSTLAAFDKLLFSHLSYSLNNKVRAFILALSSPLVNLFNRHSLKCYYHQLTRFSAALAYLSDLTMLFLGGKLKRKEALSARLGDVLSELYLASACLRYHHDHGESPEEWPYIEWILKNKLFRIQTALTEFLDNFPYPWMAKIFHFWIFPFGKHFKKPSDNLSFELAQHIMQPSALRNRLTQLCYMKKEKDDPVYRVEKAFLNVLATESISKKITMAIKKGSLSKNLPYEDQIDEAISHNIITKEEASALLETHAAVLDAIQVDAFDPNYFNSIGA